MRWQRASTCQSHSDRKHRGVLLRPGLGSQPQTLVCGNSGRRELSHNSSGVLQWGSWTRSSGTELNDIRVPQTQTSAEPQPRHSSDASMLRSAKTVFNNMAKFGTRRMASPFDRLTVPVVAQLVDRPNTAPLPSPLGGIRGEADAVDLVETVGATSSHVNLDDPDACFSGEESDT